MYPKFRFLRYNTRGYELPSDDEINVDVLTDDLATLLEHLGIQTCFAVIGVSLGGITALNFAIKYPLRLERFVACDCNVAASDKNTKSWNDRATLARTQGGWEKLADQTVKRWFAPGSVEAQKAGVVSVKEMILAASKAGFANCVGALCDFDLRESIKGIQVPGLCIVGAEDGVLPGTMAAFSTSIPECTFAEVAAVGHLPMVEDAPAFVQAILPIFELKLT